MGSVKLFDFYGTTDILSAILVFFTVSPVPPEIAQVHAGFLLYKGICSYRRIIPIPLPFFYLGGLADFISAAILLVGNPPILAEYSPILAFILLTKGIWTSFAAMQ